MLLFCFISQITTLSAKNLKVLESFINCKEKLCLWPLSGKKSFSADGSGFAFRVLSRQRAGSVVNTEVHNWMLNRETAALLMKHVLYHYHNLCILFLVTGNRHSMICQLVHGWALISTTTFRPFFSSWGSAGLVWEYCLSS